MDGFLCGLIVGYFFYPIWHRFVIDPIDRYFRNRSLIKQSAAFADYVQGHPEEFKQSFNNTDVTIKIVEVQPEDKQEEAH